ncbi:MAG: tetraacyldisaccharide 4'-kinase [Candidatus Zixiibacteriota bacterium]|nr:MAG: tetraacyldisaccharide 4'-kinase [candidate division Zixibacteria bacterium]
MLEQTWKKILRRRGFSLLSIPAFLLWLGSFVYRLGFWLKKKWTAVKVRVEVPVICVGNITVGGTGKTPMVAQLARYLINDGHRIGIVSSGYGRTGRDSVMEPGYRMQGLPVTVTGDEIKYLAHLLPDAFFAVDPVKSEAARRLAASDLVDVIIVDDGFQHFSLARDLDIVTYDAGIKKRFLKPFPLGVLREPLSALKRADVIIITRAKFAKDLYRLKERLKRINENARHYHAQFTATEIVGHKQTLPVKYLEDKSVLLFAGVGNFSSLRRQVIALCADLDYAMELSDHQIYDLELLEKIKEMADKYDPDVILTTGKDWVKVEHFDFDREIYYLNQTVDLDPGEEKLVAFLQEKLGLEKQAT